MSKVIRPFFDETDSDKAYVVGDSYSADAERIAFLVKKGFLEEKSKQPPKEETKKSPSKKKTKK